jgi:hypothetical protein
MTDVVPRVADGETLESIARSKGVHERTIERRVNQLPGMRERLREVRAEYRRTHVAHGKLSTYQYLGCRCDPCTAANTAAVLRWRRTRTTIPPHVHGTYNGYTNWRCRCDECRAAGSKANRANYRWPRDAS